jgi:hypothetical protein
MSSRSSAKPAQPVKAAKPAPRSAPAPTSAKAQVKTAAKPKPKPKARPEPMPFERIGLFERFKRLFRRDAGPSYAPSVLQETARSHEARPGSRRPLSPRAASHDDAARMLTALKEVLNRDPRSRGVLPHLGLVEKALVKRGLKGLHEVPPEVLRKALSQLETLVSDWSQVGIAALRAQIKSAMAQPGRGDAKQRRSGGAGRSSDVHDSRLEVNEASVSKFMEARANWERSATGGR